MLEQIERIKNRLQCVYKHTQMMPMLLLNLPMYMMPWSKDLLTWFVPKSRNRLSTYHHFISFPLIFCPNSIKKGASVRISSTSDQFSPSFPPGFRSFPIPNAATLCRWTPRIATLNQPTSRGEVLLRGEDVEVRHHYLDQEANGGRKGVLGWTDITDTSLIYTDITVTWTNWLRFVL